MNPTQKEKMGLQENQTPIADTYVPYTSTSGTFTPRLILTDIDGVWTDGVMYYDTLGNEWKRFNTSDSVGIYLCRQLDIPVAIFTGENTEIVSRRAQKLGVTIVKQGVKDKLACAKVLCQELNIALSEVAFIGDDINDLALLRVVGYAGCPPTSRYYIKEVVNYVTQLPGGSGAFRDFVEHLLGEERVRELVEMYHTVQR